MPYKDPKKKALKQREYRGKNRAGLAAKERDRIARLKAEDLEAYCLMTRASSKRARENASEPAKRKARASSRRHYQANKDDALFKRKNVSRVMAWYAKNTPRAKENSKRARKRRLGTDLQYKIAVALRKRMHMAIKRKLHGSSAVRDLGCSLEFFVGYLESKFRPGMTWSNWSPKGWHIDHVRSLRSFDLADADQYAAACHYTNLQPLWAADNIGKGARPIPFEHAALAA